MEVECCPESGGSVCQSRLGVAGPVDEPFKPASGR